MNEMPLRNTLLDTFFEEIRAIDPSEPESRLLERLSFALLVPTENVTDIGHINDLAMRKSPIGVSLAQCIALVNDVIKKKWLPESFGSRLLVRTQELVLSPRWKASVGGDGADKGEVEIDVEVAFRKAYGRRIYIAFGQWWEYPIIHMAQSLFLWEPSFSPTSYLARIKQSLCPGDDLDAICRWFRIIFGLSHGQCNPDTPLISVFQESLQQEYVMQFIEMRILSFAAISANCLSLPIDKVKRSIYRATGRGDTLRMWVNDLPIKK